MQEACVVSAEGPVCVLMQLPGCVRVNVLSGSTTIRYELEKIGASQFVLATS